MFFFFRLILLQITLFFKADEENMTFLMSPERDFIAKEKSVSIIGQKFGIMTQESFWKLGI